MVREIVTINVGQAGIQLSQSVWEQYCAEHSVSYDGGLIPPKSSDDEKNDIYNDDEHHGKIEKIFDLSSCGRYVPRNVCIDTEGTVVEDFIQSDLGGLFDVRTCVHGAEDAANNFARGRYTVGKELEDQFMEAMRKVTERCDRIEAFMILHAIGGGTGSGTTDIILEKFFDANKDFRSAYKIGFEIFPSDSVSTCVVEPYNSAFAVANGLSHAKNLISFVLDNGKLYNVCEKNLGLKKSKCDYNHTNALISKAITSLTASIRFDGELNLDISDMQTNLVSFPNLRYLTLSMAPMLSPQKMDSFICNAQNLTDACFQHKNFYVDIPDYSLEEDQFMGAMVMFRGNITPKAATDATKWAQDHDKCRFVDWVPCGFKLCLNNKEVSLSCDDKVKIGLSEASALMVGNNIGMGKVLSSGMKKFDVMYSERAFVHWFTGEGMEEGEFDEAKEEMDHLQADYLDAKKNQTDVPANDSDEYDESNESF